MAAKAEQTHTNKNIISTFATTNSPVMHNTIKSNSIGQINI